ncbi:GSCFA domain-containing protein [Brevundimonas lutea]|uniref:GSCFA domain-containing protein n=1 Tax=Brevundimonas lutea TaxID=2293980 RepID=UPI000F03F36A|nr:GSCFA domain-containing protein [Brevundimonas lutea]
MSDHPYRDLPQRNFWKRAVGDRHIADLADLWVPIALERSDRIATAGSCFAQHIGRQLSARGAAFMDCETAPEVFVSEEEARRFGFGVYSCRYGNIYTSRQLIQLFEECFGRRSPADGVWERNGRFFDALRPSVDPVGQDSAETVARLRERHLAAVRRMFETLDLFVFTLGLTETWESRADGTAYPSAPGAIAGRYDPQAHVFRNLRYPEIMADLTAFIAGLKQVNPGARVLFTVSPVPLVATASEDHVLPATLYSKSVLRAVAGDLAADHEHVGYFPSYEIVAGHPSRAMFFDPDLRNVNLFGVQSVMRQFFVGDLAKQFPEPGRAVADEDGEMICDEEALDRE